MSEAGGTKGSCDNKLTACVSQQLRSRRSRVWIDKPGLEAVEIAGDSMGRAREERPQANSVAYNSTLF